MRNSHCIFGRTSALLIAVLSAANLWAADIHDAAAAGDLNKVRALLDADPALLESANDLGFRPLHSACFAGKAAVANLLLDRGADITAKDRFQHTPLSRAAYFAGQDLSLVRRLIEKGADVNSRGYNGLTPLHFAALKGDLEVATLLLDRGADPNSFDSYTGPTGTASVSGTALQIAIRHHPQEAMAMLLVERGAKLNRRDEFGNTELHLAAFKGYAELTKLLLARGAQTEAIDQSGHTALYYAAKHGYRRAAEALIAAGVNQSPMTEANFGKAPQLAAALHEGEAWLWSLGGQGYAVKTKGRLVIFNPEFDEAPEAGLANGHLNPAELAGQKIIGLITTPERWWQALPATFELAKRIPGVSSVIYAKPAADHREVPAHRAAGPHETLVTDGIRVHTIPALAGGMGYLVEADGLKILHAGLHVAGNDAAEVAAYRKEIDFLKPFGPIDIAIVSVHSHSNSVDFANETHLYLIDQLAPKAILLFGANIPEQYHNCAKVLRARKIPVTFPEQQWAGGERFHFIRDQAQKTPPQQAHSVSGPYFGLTPPGQTPQIFARGIVSKDGLLDGGPYFTPDGNEVIWRENLPPGPERKEWVFRAWTMRRENGVWPAPQPPPFAGTGTVLFPPDGQRAYFSPFRSGAADDIWFAERQGSGWSEPKCLNFVSRWPELKFAYVHSVASNGSLYLVAHAPGLFENSGIYRARLVDGDYTRPELLPRNINLPPFLNWTPFVAPDESYLLFSSTRPGGHGRRADLFIAFRNPDGSWTDPAGLGEPINTEEQERSPAVSPDGKYLFFTRGHDAVHNVYWVDASVLEPLRLQARGWASQAGDYLGQPPPGMTPQVFARGIVSVDDKEHGVPALSPDGNEVFWREARPPGPNNTAWLGWAMTMRRENGRWSAPRLAPYPSLPAFSADGRRLYFGAPRLGATREDGEHDIWVAEKQGDGWGAPQCLNLISRAPALQFATWPSIARNGNLYFISSVPEQRNRAGIARARWVNGQYEKPELLPGNINLAPYRNWVPFIAPDESYLIFSSTRPGSLDNEGDLYITRPLAGGSWTDPKPLGGPVNTGTQERFSGLSPDGKYFFFTRWSREHDEDVYWVSAAAIPELTPVATPAQGEPK